MRLIILIGLLYVAWRLVKSVMPPAGGVRRTFHGPDRSSVDEMLQDPLCGVYFPKGEGVSLMHNGKEIWFCSNECKNKYLDANS